VPFQPGFIYASDTDLYAIDQPAMNLYLFKETGWQTIFSASVRIVQVWFSPTKQFLQLDGGEVKINQNNSPDGWKTLSQVDRDDPAPNSIVYAATDDKLYSVNDQSIVLQYSIN